ncbi:40S ribosomal protein S27A (nucleomorph) [Cryptomonas paramecium]|uniref:40S ribosomal protein S27A n=1 Tax=Cryptomonas paramaecium TaxID=2898 RepID=F2HHK0_9CRYP|nr:40S ribosomal protein S27A [Cryptomonas paramecium]AEA38796.1 40S ribosomal protein S27A [Cryptomonas paramecium]
MLLEIILKPSIMFQIRLSSMFFFRQENGLSVVQLKGGAKKRKKKNYTKPKKSKHVKKKVKLRYLQYYNVDHGEVQKLRKISPEYPGCFMAEHKDRLSCGKSGLSYTRI